MYAPSINRIFIPTLLSALLLAGCGGSDSSTAPAIGDSGGGSEQTTQLNIGGSVGDGPIINATVRLRDASNNILATTTSDGMARYSFDVSVPTNAFPLTIEAEGGIDLVTGMAPDFQLESTVVNASQSNANLNPHSSMIVKLARAKGGLTSSNVSNARDTVIELLNFGFDPALMADPITASLTNNNLPMMIKSSETLAEALRRVRDNALSSNVTVDEVMDALADDLVDGSLDGEGDDAASQRYAALLHVISSEVLYEAMHNRLKVNNVDASTALDGAIQTTAPAVTLRTGDVRINRRMIEQARRSVAAARQVDDSANLTALADALDRLSGNVTPTAVEQVLPDTVSNDFSSLVGSTRYLQEVRLGGIIQAGNQGAGPNRAPLISGTPVSSVAVNSTFNFTPTASDADGDQLSFNVTNLPSWAVFAPENGTITGTPSSNDLGLYQNVRIGVFDGHANADIVFNIEVTDGSSSGGNSNSAPSISGSPSSSVAENSNYSFTPSASDPDGDALSFSITNLPSWASFNDQTGQLSGTPGTGDAGVYQNITLIVTDGQASSSLAAFSIEVGASSAAPSISGNPTRSVEAGSGYSFTPSAADPDGDDLDFSISSLPSWAQFDTNTGTLSGTPQSGDVGSYSGITIQVTDGQSSVSLPAFSINVSEAIGAGGSGNNYYVDNQISGSSCTDYSITDRSCGGGSDTAFDSFSGATAVAQAGDTVYVREGRFKEQLKVRNDGAAGNYVTFRNYESETVTITGATLKPAIDLTNREYVVIQGFTVEKVGRWLYFLEAHNNIVRDNSFSQAYDTAGSKAGIFFFHASHNRFLNNTLEDNADDALSLVDSERNLVAGNSIRNAHHALWDIRCGNYNVLRNNYFYNDQQKDGEVYDCDGQVKTYKYDSTRRNLIEGNEFDYTANSGNKSPFSGIQYAGQQGIIRLNRFHDTTGPGLRMAIYGVEAKNNWGNRVYNNVMHSSEFAGTWLQPGGDKFFDNIFKNNLLGGSSFVNNDSRWDWWNNTLKGKPVQAYIDRSDGYEFDTNIFVNASGDQEFLAVKGNGNRTSTSQRTIAEWNSGDSNFRNGSVVTDARFIDESGRDFRLQNDSPLIDAGTFLTQTLSAGSGTELPVEDASFFYDGFDIPGEQGDEIMLDGDSQAARVVSIDYNTNTLTLDRSLSWNSGQGVSLKYNGSAPDVGAFESGN
jgi:parallel beta-helix repeat protein